MTENQTGYRIFMAVFAVLMLGWAITYGYANYQLDECSQSLRVRIETVKAQIDANQRSIDQKK
jgi:hypothetical protein